MLTYPCFYVDVLSICGCAKYILNVDICFYVDMLSLPRLCAGCLLDATDIPTTTATYTNKTTATVINTGASHAFLITMNYQELDQLMNYQEMDQLMNYQEMDQLMNCQEMDQLMNCQEMDQLMNYQEMDQLMKYEFMDELMKYELMDQLMKCQ